MLDWSPNQRCSPPESHAQDWRQIDERAAEDSAAAFQEAETFLHEQTPKTPKT
jgi:hypothetical protein